MTEVEVIEKPSHDGKRTALVLAEDRVGHYPEFREFFIRRFSLETNGLSKPGYIRGPSGAIYSLVFVGRSGEPFPDGLEVYALVDALEPLSEKHRSLGIPEVDDPGHWRRMEGRGSRCNRPLVSAPVFVPTRLTDLGPLVHPFPWKMQRTNTSRCGAASTKRVANALPVTA
jgi:hypothetical protein